MENRDNEMTNGQEAVDATASYVATFENHYKAMLFKKGMGQGCVLRPVPRLLSSSCGTAAFFTGSRLTGSRPMSLKADVLHLTEAVYVFEEGKEGSKDGGYHEVYRQQ